MNLITIKRAIFSVSDKTGIVEFARRLEKWGVEIISTGGTYRTLRGAGVQAISVSDVTGFPEILDGRVKTLHPKIHGALLAATDNPNHAHQLEELGIQPIDMVVSNLYPFERTITDNGVELDQAIEQIDIGGPAMLRSAAKNFKHKLVIVNPQRYPVVADQMDKNGGAVDEATRFNLAKEVFLHTARYDTVIHEYLARLVSERSELPDLFSLSLLKSADLRYGENPHQSAALYGKFGDYFTKLHGKDLSYNNIIDVQAAADLIDEFSEPVVAIIKHTNPCGVGKGNTLSEAYEKALATDRKSAFGGIVGTNRPMELSTARLIDGVFTEIIIAPGFDDEALAFLQKKKDRRLIRRTPTPQSRKGLGIKRVDGGVLLQTLDDTTVRELTVVTKRHPNDEEMSAMIFGWKVAKHVKSNAIVYARPERTVGIGAGQMSRFDSSRVAVMKAADAGLDLRGTAVASDAFFPFADGLLEAVKAGATAVIQPGGSVRDQEVIRAADDNNISMVFTGIRHFNH